MQCICSGNAVPADDQSLLFHPVKVGFAGTVTEDMDLPFLFVELVTDFLMGEDVSEQTAPDEHFPDIRFVIPVGGNDVREFFSSGVSAEFVFSDGGV